MECRGSYQGNLDLVRSAGAYFNGLGVGTKVYPPCLT